MTGPALLRPASEVATQPTTSEPEVISRPPADGWQRRRERISLEIERAALELFARSSPEDVTIDHIAEAAGISNRTFFRYFATRDEVLAALPRRSLGRLSELVRARPPSESVCRPSPRPSTPCNWTPRRTSWRCCGVSRWTVAGVGHQGPRPLGGQRRGHLSAAHRRADRGGRRRSRGGRHGRGDCRRDQLRFRPLAAPGGHGGPRTDDCGRPQHPQGTSTRPPAQTGGVSAVSSTAGGHPAA